MNHTLTLTSEDLCLFLEALKALHAKYQRDMTEIDARLHPAQKERKRHKLSAATRKRMGEAQRARWERERARTMTAEAS